MERKQVHTSAKALSTERKNKIYTYKAPLGDSLLGAVHQMGEVTKSQLK